MRKAMLLAAMLAMILAAAAPALGQTAPAFNALGAQFGEGNVQCVQNATQFGGAGGLQLQYGAGVQEQENVNVQVIAQECNISAAAVHEILDVLVATATATATHTATPAAVVQYPAAAVQYQYPAAAVQYQYAATLPPTGGVGGGGASAAIALGAGALLVAGGLAARRLVR